MPSTNTGELTTYGIDPSALPGATRIGTTWLHVPPINIQINNPKFTNTSQNMRSSSPNFHVSGRGIYSVAMDIVFSGTAQINGKLALLLAQFRRTPFLTIYNDTICQTISYKNIGTEIPVAITGYSIHTEMDLPDTLIMKLTFIIFNATPLINNWQYLKQIVDTNGNPVYDVPAINIEDSNLFAQYYQKLLIDYDKLPDPMFLGEVDIIGRTPINTFPLNGQLQQIVQQDFTSRTAFNNNSIIRNGSYIRRVNTNGYINQATNFTIGYHVKTIQEALDLSLGAYQSRRLTTGTQNQWISNDADLRRDIIQSLGIADPGSTVTTQSLINTNAKHLLDVAVVNNANKYIKKFTIEQQDNNSPINILGITLRRSIMINTQPIISGSMPTAQYLGGATTDISITMETNNEEILQLITTIDRGIEESQRAVTRQSGTELTYITNDIVNLNGSFIVTPVGLDIQTVPDNPGTYIMTWNFSEQAESLDTLFSAQAPQMRDIKKNLLKAIIYSHADWTFTDSYTTDFNKYNFKYTNGGPSYVHTVIIPSLIEGLRSGFQRYVQNNIITLENQADNNGNGSIDAAAPLPTFTSENIAQAFYYANVSTTYSVDSSTPAAQDISAMYAGKAQAFNNTWQIMHGNQSNQSGPAVSAIYNAFYKWLISMSTDGTPQDGVAEILVDGDMKKFELMMRSPQLLDYEVQWMGGLNNTTLNIPNSNKTFSLKQFTDATSSMNCYRDLGLPFNYQPVDAQNIAISNAPQITYLDPDFYMYSSSAVQGTGAPASNSYNPYQSASTIKKNIYSHIENQSANKITGGLGKNIPAAYSACSLSFSGLGNSSYDGPIDKTKTDPSKRKADSINNTDLSNVLQDQQANLTGTQQAQLLQQSQVKTVNGDNIFLSDNMAAIMGVTGRETNNATIFDAQREHKIIKSTFYDLNPNIDNTLHNIVADARDTILSDPKYYTINRAFPTFRLFFRLENNPQWLLFDELFDYRAVESIRYFKEKASPTTTLHIVLNNYNNSLTDLKALMAKRTFSTKTQNNNDQVINPYTNNPLRSLFVQAGTQIQLKMGYRGDHENLTTVFNGFVSDVQPGEKFEIICQSYGMELLTDANVGSFAGWACTPKVLIWWMLSDDKVKHLGDKVDLRPMINGVQDLGSGLFTMDHNIFINEFLEPGKVRIFQSYNADNMSKWDLLQDIAAAHPGYICQVVPFDDRETIFFGHPDQLYTWTQDIGATQKYRLSIGGNNGSSIQNNPSALLTFDQALQGLAQANPPTNIINQVSEALAGPPTLSLNYLQWLAYKDKISEAYDNWIKSWTKDQTGTSTNGLDPVIQSLLEYCHWVELLINIAGDPLSGNIEYNLFDNKAETLSQTSKTSTNSSTYVSNSVNTTNPTPSQRLGQQNAVQPNPVSNNTNTNQVDTPGATARIADQYLVDKPVYIPKEIWTTIPIDLQMRIAKNLVGVPLTLDKFNPSNGLMQGIQAALGGTSLTWSALAPNNVDGTTSANNAQFNANLDNIATTAQTYFANLDEVAVGQGSPTNATAMESALFAVYQAYGISSLMAIIAWVNIGQLMEKITGASSLKTLNNTTTLFTNKALNITVGIGDAAGPNTIVNPQTGGIIFTGPINTTSLKTHKALRNLILNRFTNISPLFQELLAEVAESPIHKRFRQYHFKSSYQHIVNNNIWNNLTDMWNRVKVKYKRNDFMDLYVPILPTMILGDKLNNDFVIQAGQTLDDRITREIVVPIENARTVSESRNYATSLLAEGIRHMYTGSLTLLGDPDIKPYDIIYIYDDYNKMYGPIEVKSVEHIMSHESGFITIVEPHAYVDVLGVSTSLAAKIATIFDYGMLALIAVPTLIELGSSLAIGGAGVLAAEEVAEVAGGSFLKDTLANALTLGKTVYNRAAGYIAENAAVQGTATAEAYTAYVNADITEFLSQEFATSTPQVETELKEILNVTDLGKASQADLQSALVQIGVDQTKAARFISQLQINAIGNGLKAGADVGLGILSTSGAYLANAAGLTQLNILKFLAVSAPVIYYQMMAGIDDHNYACPLNITPLSYNGEPYLAGLDSLTHQSGILNYVKGQWMKFEGSLTTIGSVLGEYASSISQTFGS